MINTTGLAMISDTELERTIEQTFKAVTSCPWVYGVGGTGEPVPLELGALRDMVRLYEALLSERRRRREHIPSTSRCKNSLRVSTVHGV